MDVRCARIVPQLAANCANNTRLASSPRTQDAAVTVMFGSKCPAILMITCECAKGWKLAVPSRRRRQQTLGLVKDDGSRGADQSAVAVRTLYSMVIVCYA